MKKLNKKAQALLNKETRTYMVNITPCSPFDGHDGKGENIEITTDDIDYSMRQYQRNRLPFIWDIKSIYDPK